MTQPHDKIWARQTTGWGGIDGGQWRNVPMMTDEPEIFAPVYLLATPAREAANDLLEALEEALLFNSHDDDGIPAVWLKQALAAIDKAKGGEA